MANAAESIASLRKERGSLKARLTTFTNFLNDLGDTELTQDKIITIERRMDSVLPLLDRFYNVQDRIDLLTDETDEPEIAIQLQARTDFEGEYYHQLCRANKIVAPFQPSTSMADNVSVAFNAARGFQNIQLPKINMPTFSGVHEQWLEFRDKYLALIHTNAAIADIEKFHYLRASLTGEAAIVLHSIEFTESNYEHAWELVQRRYNNVRVLMHNHMKAFFNIEQMHVESANKLRGILDTLLKHLNSLKHLVDPDTDLFDMFLIFIVTSKLDPTTAREWEERLDEDKLPTLANLEAFIHGKCNLLSTLELQRTVDRGFINKQYKANKHNQVNNHANAYKINSNSTTVQGTSNPSGNYKCQICQKEHYLRQCPEFLKLTPVQRLDKIKSLNRCTNCLRFGHSFTSCSAGPCRVCGQRHHTLLHKIGDAETSSHLRVAALPSSAVLDDRSVAEVVSVPSCNIGQHCAPASRPRHPSSSIHIAHEAGNVSARRSNIPTILLSTAIITILDQFQTPHRVRALLDSGSQSNFITESLASKLKLARSSLNLTVVGISKSASQIKTNCDVSISSRCYDFSTNLNCLIIPDITGNVPNVFVNKSLLKIPNNLILADPSFHIPGPVDVLLGAECFYNLLSIGQISLGQQGPMLQKTKLGWVISGRVSDMRATHSRSAQCNLFRNDSFDLTRFWEIEQISDSNTRVTDDNYCETNFIKTTERDETGRFIVKIPFKTTFQLGNSYDQALKRFISLERKFKKNVNLFNAYSSFINEYIQLKHMSLDTAPSTDEPNYYLPHHAVYNEHSLTTKLRVVFDGSAKSTNGSSLNDVQAVGPILQDDLLSILLRFRKYNYVITADVEKMYRQVLVHPSQRAYQRILWRSAPAFPIETYVLNTVTYGTGSASYLAIRCLHQLANDVKNIHPNTAHRIKRDFYVDDLITGANSVHEAKALCRSIDAALNAGQFTLRKWLSNDANILTDFGTDRLLNIDFGENEHSKTLGLLWSPKTDSFTFRINTQPLSTRITKRIILSIVAQIFDPLGLISATTVMAKILIQKLWSAKLNWDESIPAPLHMEWCRFRESLQHLNSLNIPRHIASPTIIRVELHGFSDASEKAYGAAVYIRSIDAAGNIFSSLLSAKSKVAPLKQLTIPRLELCGALLLARLINKVTSSMELTFQNTFLWTDSTIVLCWLKTLTDTLMQFVRNRVLEIKDLTQHASWRHVPTKENPADLLSRGIYPNDLLNSSLWWHGPGWLSQDQISWPESQYNIPVLPDIKERICLSVQFENVGSLIKLENYSSLTKIRNIFAYMIRFCNNCRIKLFSNRTFGSITVDERQYAHNKLLKYVQVTAFKKEIDALAKGKEIPSNSRILSLAPFLDDEGLLRVGGRLKNSNLNFAEKHQILLPKSNHLANLIFLQAHKKSLHVGPLGLLHTIRLKYWPLGARDTARKIVQHCITCFRAKPRRVEPQMGQLPRSRVSPSPPFFNCGTDYAGPFTIKASHLRGGKAYKAWVVVFVCMSTKAIHLELVTSLSSEAFLAALRRFTSRRGKPRHVFSDNGTNYVGANREITELFDFIKTEGEKLSNNLSEEGISWHFIPPHSPHFGGLWEACVKSVKHHLKRVVNDQCFTFEEFYTLLTQIEAILNSRPLSTLSSDPNDLSPLTPAHLLIGRPFTSMPDADYSFSPISRLSRYQHIQKMTQDFWNRWSREYVNELQQRTKWKASIQKEVIQPGTLVLLVDDQHSSTRWRLGRIVETHPGKDNVVRAVSIRTEKGIVRRAVQKVCPLPLIETTPKISTATPTDVSVSNATFD